MVWVKVYPARYAAGEREKLKRLGIDHRYVKK
jgi:hypothetical protein